MRAVLACVLVAAAGCGGGSDARTPDRPTTTSTTTSTTTTTVPVVVTTAPRPTDPDGLRCQAVVEQRLAELAAAVPPGVDAVCRHRDIDALLAARGAGAYYSAPTIVVGYPRPGPPGWEERVWRAAVAHELGHAWWFAHSRVDAMTRYREIRGADLIAPFIEDYADVFAAVVGGETGGDVGLRYIKTPPPPEQVAALCAEGLLPC